MELYIPGIVFKLCKLYPIYFWELCIQAIFLEGAYVLEPCISGIFFGTLYTQYIFWTPPYTRYGGAGGTEMALDSPMTASSHPRPCHAAQQIFFSQLFATFALTSSIREIFLLKVVQFSPFLTY